MKRLIEIRSYRLKPGTTPQFHAAFVSDVMPLLGDWKTDVVAFGPSDHEPDTYFLIRAYDDLADLNTQQEAFYGSDAWRNGPRETMVSQIDHYLSTVLWLSPGSIDDLRRLNASGSS